jgi:hypothetical protein
LFLTSTCQVQAETREQYINQTKSTYNPAAGARRAALENPQGGPELGSTIKDRWAGREPIFYGDGSPAYHGQELLRIASKFFQCVDFGAKVSDVRWSWRRGLLWKWTMWYKFPVQKIHTHHFKQNRYLPGMALSGQTPLFRAIYELTPLQTRLKMARADSFAKQELVSHWFLPGLSLANPAEHYFPDSFEAFSNSKFRQQSGMNNSTSLQEYHIGITLFHELFMALKYLVPYLNTMLSWTNCQPPEKIPVDMSSDMFFFLMATRVNPPLYPFLQTFRDRTLRTDWNRQIDPRRADMCTRFKVNSGEIPRDMYDNVAPIYNPIPQLYPELINPNNIRGQNRGRWSRICHPKLGTIFPYTTQEVAGSHDIVTAQVSIIKAIRFFFAHYLTFFHQGNFPTYQSEAGLEYVSTNPRNWDRPGPGYYNLTLSADTFQMVYPSNSSCKKIGAIAPKFANADTQKTPGKDGLYSFVHWKYFNCTSGWRPAFVFPSPF